MSGDGKSKGGRKRPLLSPQDSALWDYVTRDVRPTGAKPRVRIEGSALDSELDGSLPTATVPKPPPAREPRPRPPAVQRQAPPPAPPDIEPVRPIVLERRKARRLARGAEEIDARLDLHGMTQDEAHRALELFLRRAHNDGLRTVIVITGKGGTGPTGEAEAGTYAGNYARRERGVLRRMVPLWLDGSGLRPIVISYSNAHVRHGGGGALYVMLRRPGR